MDIQDYVNTNNDSKEYDKIIEELQIMKSNNTPIEEGLFKAVLGGVAGMTFMPSLMGFVCDALGIDKKGQLGSLMTSRFLLTFVCGKMGWKA